MLLAIASRPSDVNPTFVTGADVSRYQRRTVPAKPGGSGDERVKAVIPNLLPWQQLQHEVKRLNARIEELEEKLKSMSGSSGSSNKSE